MASASSSDIENVPKPVKLPPKRIGKGKVRFDKTPLETHLETDENRDYGLTRKERLQALFKKKKECDAIAKEIVLSLLEPNVSRSYLLEKAWKIGTPHWDDVVEERRLVQLCGWCLCDEKLGSIPKQQYVIRGKKVLDITERKSFCSSHCYAASQNFKSQLLDSPLWMREEEEAPEFEILEDTSVRLEGIAVKLNSLNLSDIEDEEEDGKKDTEESDED